MNDEEFSHFRKKFRDNWCKKENIARSFNKKYILNKKNI